MIKVDVDSAGVITLGDSTISLDSESSSDSDRWSRICSQHPGAEDTESSIEVLSEVDTVVDELASMEDDSTSTEMDPTFETYSEDPSLPCPDEQPPSQKLPKHFKIVMTQFARGWDWFNSRNSLLTLVMLWHILLLTVIVVLYHPFFLRRGEDALTKYHLLEEIGKYQQLCRKASGDIEALNTKIARLREDLVSLQEKRGEVLKNPPALTQGPAKSYFFNMLDLFWRKLSNFLPSFSNDPRCLVIAEKNGDIYQLMRDYGGKMYWGLARVLRPVKNIVTSIF